MDTAAAGRRERIGDRLYERAFHALSWRVFRRATVLLAFSLVLLGIGPATEHAAGAATYRGSAARLPLARPIVGMAPTRTGAGYWLVASDGGIFSFGDARFYGSTGALQLVRPVVGMAATPSGRGYWLVASDGGIFTFGDAHFYGSTGAMRLARPVVGMARTRTGRGYWMVASDGGIFSFGDARFYGSTGALRLVLPVVGMAASVSGRGYWMVAADGGIFSFGDARFSGSATRSLAGQWAIAMAASPDGNGYWIASQWGVVDAAASGHLSVDPNITGGSGGRAIANDLINRINRERAARGLSTLFVDPLVQAYASAWAAHLSATNTFVHQNLLNLLHAANGRFIEAGENLFRASGAPAMNAGTAHVALMESPEHRANILLPEERYVGVGAVCAHGFLVVVEDFATPASIALHAHGVPPLNPIVAGAGAGAHC